MLYYNPAHDHHRVTTNHHIHFRGNPQSWDHPALQVLFNFIALLARFHNQNHPKSYMNVLTTLYKYIFMKYEAITPHES